MTWHRDHYESQLDATAGKLLFPTRSTELLQRQVVEMLLQEYGRSPAESILEITQKNQRKWTNVNINPLALSDERVELDAAERRRIVALALQEPR